MRKLTCWYLDRSEILKREGHEIYGRGKTENSSDGGTGTV